MPCFITGSARGDAELDDSEAHEEAQKVTRMLCAIMQELEMADSDYLVRDVPGLGSWWNERKRIDAEREKEKARIKKQKEIEKQVAAYRKKLNSEK